METNVCQALNRRRQSHLKSQHRIFFMQISTISLLHCRMSRMKIITYGFVNIRKSKSRLKIVIAVGEVIKIQSSSSIESRDWRANASADIIRATPSIEPIERQGWEGRHVTVTTLIKVLLRNYHVITNIKFSFRNLHNARSPNGDDPH